MLGGIHRVAERTGQTLAMESALTSNASLRGPCLERAEINRAVADDKVVDEAPQSARRLARGPTRARVVDKAPLRTWSAGGVNAAGDTPPELELPLFEIEDVRSAPPAAVEIFKAGLPRTGFAFKGR
jgi:enoyl-CoA hydratase/carnithine racemase